MQPLTNSQPMAWINGTFVHLHAPAIPLLDQAYLSGMGVFETILADHGEPRFLEAHLKRLEISATLLGLKSPPPEVIRTAIVELLHLNHLHRARIRLNLSCDLDASGIPFQSTDPIRCTILAFPMASAAKKPMRLCISSVPAPSARSPLAGIKSTSYGLHALAMRQARNNGADEAVLLNENQHLVSCATANLFWIKNNVIHTPHPTSGCRSGVTRERVIAACNKLQFEVVEMTTAPIDELTQADEVFLTSAVRGMVRVDSLECQRFQPTDVIDQIESALNDCDAAADE